MLLILQSQCNMDNSLELPDNHCLRVDTKVYTITLLFRNYFSSSPLKFCKSNSYLNFLEKYMENKSTCWLIMGLFLAVPTTAEVDTSQYSTSHIYHLSQL